MPWNSQQRPMPMVAVACKGPRACFNGFRDRPIPAAKICGPEIYNFEFKRPWQFSQMAHRTGSKKRRPGLAPVSSGGEILLP